MSLPDDYRVIWEEMTRDLYKEGGHYEPCILERSESNHLLYRFGSPLTLEEALFIGKNFERTKSVRIVFPSKLPTSGV